MSQRTGSTVLVTLTSCRGASHGHALITPPSASPSHAFSVAPWHSPTTVASVVPLGSFTVEVEMTFGVRLQAMSTVARTRAPKAMREVTVSVLRRSGGTGSLGRRSHCRQGQLRDWNPRRTHHAVHHAVASAPHERFRPASGEERSGTGWPRCGSCPRRHRLVHRHVAQTASPFTDLGPRRRDGAACPTPNRDWITHLLLRPTQSVAARHEREYQRPPSPVLS